MRHAVIHGTATASFCVEALGTSGLARLHRDHVSERVSTVRKLYDLSIDPG
jgi:hypothetical protein